ncbi:MAG: hypothetical protein SGILL_009343 [Bacillariaceae sp.]
MRIAPFDPSSNYSIQKNVRNQYLSSYSNNRHKHQPYQIYSPPLSSSPTTIPTNTGPVAPPQSTSIQKKHALIIAPDHTSTSAKKTNNFMAHRCVALDCEMVGVGPGGKISVLARVSVVDWYGRKILDSFVHVEERVTDYRTHVSGVTEKDLKGPKALNFGLVRKQVKQLMKNKIIVGHGLENDLRALKIEQDFPWYNIRDSATQYSAYMRVDQFGQLRPRRLRDLAWYNLGIVIQQEGKSHDSLEDARAAMALYRNVQPNWDYEMDCRRRNAFATYAPPMKLTRSY